MVATTEKAPVAIELQGLVRRFGERTALQGLTVAVPAPTPYALPLFVESLVTATMEVLDGLQEAEASA